MSVPDQASPVLLGDSIFRRLLKRNPSVFAKLSWQTAISGQTAAELHRVVVGLREELRGRRVILMIGTNDCLKGQAVERTRAAIHRCVLLLRRLKCEVAICELLPIPKISKEASGCSAVLKLNEYIRSLGPSGVRVVRIHDDFLIGGLIKLYLYCSHLKRRCGREVIDLVHPNTEGLDCLWLAIES